MDYKNQTENQARRENLKEWAESLDFDELEYMLNDGDKRAFLRFHFKTINALPIFIREWRRRKAKLNNGNGIPPKPKVLGILPNFI